MTVPLSRTLDPADYSHFEPELRVINQYDPPVSGHLHRRWEYALALHAIGLKAAEGSAWRGGEQTIYDVGPLSPFYEILAQWTQQRILLVDDLAATVVPGVRLASVITCLSVVEHIPDLAPFLYHLSCLLAPGGLLVLTMDYWHHCGADTAVGHEMRNRIFCPRTYASLRSALATRSLHTFGGVDARYHGNQVHDYTFASLVLEKKRS